MSVSSQYNTLPLQLLIFFVKSFTWVAEQGVLRDTGRAARATIETGP